MCFDNEKQVTKCQKKSRQKRMGLYLGSFEKPQKIPSERFKVMLS